MYLRTPRLDRPATASRSSPTAGEIRPTITGPTPARSTWAAPRCSRATSRPGAPDGARRADRGRAHLGLPARLDRQPAVRDPRRREDELAGARPCRRSGRPSKRTSCFPTARTCRGTPAAGAPGRDPRADLRARRGGDALLRHRRHRRRGGARARGGPGSGHGRRSSSTAASSRSQVGDGPAINLTGWARAGLRGPPQRPSS